MCITSPAENRIFALPKGSNKTTNPGSKPLTMKKQVLFSAAMVAAIGASAQTGEITSNRGENWLSQSGDWGLTIDATPFLNYAGNLLNGSLNNNAPAFNFNNQMLAIQGKKLIDANTAYRGMVRIGFGNQKTTDFEEQNPLPTPPPTFPNPNPQVENVTKDSNFDLVLGGGIEKRKGSTRVVGVYGAMAYVSLGTSKRTREFGNALSNDNPDQRDIEVKNGSTFGLGLMAFGGVEWFCAPKVSLSGEYTWGLAMTSQGYSETTTEYWVPNQTGGGTVTAITEETGPKTSSFGIDTGVTGARLGLNFYFQ